MKPQVVLLSLFACVLALCFTNCGPGFSALDGSELTSLGALTKCEQQLYTTFSSQIHPFTAKNCAGCHNANGTSNVFFAQSNKVLAFKAFMLPGFDKFKSYAVNPGHVNGITGTPAAQSLVDAAEPNWTAAEKSAACVGGTTPGEFAVLTASVPIAATATNRTIVWNLGNQVAEGTPRAGATIQINARVATPAGSLPTYYLSAPVLKTGADGLTIQDVSIYINGEEFIEGTTFHAIDAYVAPNTTTNTSLSPNTLLAQIPNLNAATDTIALKISYLNVGNTSGGAGGGGGGGPGGALDGVALYAQHCASCHNALANTSKPRRTAQQIQNSINTVGSMRSLSILTPAQVAAIAAALDN